MKKIKRIALFALTAVFILILTLAPTVSAISTGEQRSPNYSTDGYWTRLVEGEYIDLPIPAGTLDGVPNLAIFNGPGKSTAVNYVTGGNKLLYRYVFDRPDEYKEVEILFYNSSSFSVRTGYSTATCYLFTDKQIEDEDFKNPLQIDYVPN